MVDAWTLPRGVKVVHASLPTVAGNRASALPPSPLSRDTARAMSQENVESLRALLEALDVEAWRRGEDMSLLDPEVAYEDMTLPDHVGETYRGHEGVARATERWVEPYEGFTIELERIVGAGDRLVSIHRVRARARYTGIEAEGPVAYVWTFRGGKVIHFESFRDPEQALEAAGLSY